MECRHAWLGLLLAATLVSGCAAGQPTYSARAVTQLAARETPTSDASPATEEERIASRQKPAPPTAEPEPSAPAPHDQAEPPTAADLLVLDDPPRCPAEMALILDGICIDRWESTLVVIGSDGQEQGWSPFRTPEATDRPLRAVSRPGVVPQGYVSGEQAERACRASGKRLCSAAEWETACRGPARTTYPYGNERQSETCNDDGRRVHPVAEVTERLDLPRDRMWYEGMDHPLINQLNGTLRKTGERESCTNDYGVFDMVGNLHEWIEDPDGTFRGGYYLDTIKNGEGCQYATTAHSKKYHDYSTGFRCCLDADPVE